MSCGCGGSSSAGSAGLFGVFVEEAPATAEGQASRKVRWDLVIAVAGLILAVIALARRR